MKIRARLLVVTLLLPALGHGQSAPASREDAYRANNVGVALLEQFKYKEGAEAFGRALKIDPKLAIARINLAIALYNVPDLVGAEREAKAAALLAPAAPQPHYVLGLVARTQNRAEEAIAAFKKVLAADAGDVGANVNLGQIYAQNRQFDEAVAVFRAAMEAEPYNITAAYNLATALMRAGAKEEGQLMLARFEALRKSGAGTSIGPNYLEQGRYAEAVSSTGLEPGLVSAETPKVSFAAAAGVLPEPLAAGEHVVTSVTPIDFDRDGDLDLFVGARKGQWLLRNDGGRFVDATPASGLDVEAAETLGAVAGDFDNDGAPDLFVFRRDGRALYRNAGGGRFADATAASKIPAYGGVAATAAFVDADHDGDLDLFVAGSGADAKPAPAALYRNNGDGTFADVTAESRVGAAPLAAVAVVPTDFDNRRDVDLVVAGDAVRLLRNLRDGTFRDVATEVGLPSRASGALLAAGDVNKDGFTDLYIGSLTGEPGTIALSDGRARFVAKPAPAATAGARHALFADYDNDGLLDLVLGSERGLRVLRNTGGEWADVTGVAVAGGLAPSGEGAVALLAAGDFDRDGDTDLLVRDAAGRLVMARNEGGNARRSIAVDLTGRVSNRSGVGSKIEARAGSLLGRFEYYSASPAPAPADIVFGLGARQSADAVRVLWPTGIIQAETELPAPAGQAAAATLAVTELDRKPSSCPFLYTWNGERFEFVTDFMGGGEMGYWLAPGVWSSPDPDEYVRIRGDQLVPRDGRLELRVTNELEEVLFVDRLRLLAVDHPADVEVYPHEGLLATPPPFELVATRGARPPVSAVDGEGRDWTASVARVDRDFVKGFALESIRGYAEPHELTLDLGDTGPGRTLLLLTGWTDYAFSSDNVAAAQRGLSLAPPRLEVRDERGEWVPAIENIGIPVGRPQTLVVDLTGRFPTASREVRIVTNMRIYWDRILVDTAGARPRTRVTTLEPLTAELRWRGYSRETSPDGIEPWGYDYDDVSPVSPWKVFEGRYTREGDVGELLRSEDDIFVVSRTGDEIALSFDARALPRVRRGWTRTYLLYAYGYSKEMDVNSASPYRVEPLPFRGMSGYPYTAGERYPDSPAHRDYLERYNTRVVASPLPQIESALGGARRTVN